MNISEQIPKLLVVGVLMAGIAVIVSKISSPTSGRQVDVTVPVLSEMAEQGRGAFDANCAQCNGQTAVGSETGPPLVHKIYNSGHHANAVFFLAAQRGVPRHHRTFGNMPSQPQITEAVMKEIVRYVRELQLANGIKYQPHRM